MQILTWNLFHGRAVPPAGRDLHREFAAALAGWTWDVALLQEVPPWWAPALARACDAHARTALTSRNELPALRRAVADRAPDLVKSGGGGANVILVRAAAARIADHRRVLLRRWPERRVCHAVRLGGGLWCANLHAQVHSVARAQADIDRAAAATRAWAGGEPALLGGDFNIRAPAAAGFDHLGGDGVDHVLGYGVAAAGPVRVLKRGPLSDHAPLLVTVSARAAGPAG
ncbi:MAG TPA: endonuclease/exonuclease/phosphatase family protein [Solirubrobacteraceae bacterium]|jgi:endonuclease/exonuclease/phosphatase family metal-dependent hydrolase|nr:endonuclease/exonuclease/phosphatase family protein [Solirubrobacteraceae bacterium]